MASVSLIKALILLMRRELERKSREQKTLIDEKKASKRITLRFVQMQLGTTTAVRQ